MSTRFEVPAEKLAWRCDLSFLPYSCTAEMTPLEDFIGQDRAIRAIEFGLGVNKPGFNIFVTGLTGTGKTSIIKAFLKKITNRQMVSVADSPVPEDWCYVYNFTDADRPLALRIRRGWGKVLKTDMEQFVQSVQREAKKMFESDEYAHQRQEMVEQIQKKQQQTMEGLIEEANRGGFTLRMTPSGIVLLPTKDGKPMQEADYLALPTAEKKRLEETRGEIEKKSKMRCAKEENSKGRSARSSNKRKPGRRTISCACRLPISKKNTANIPKSSPISTVCAIIFSKISDASKAPRARPARRRWDRCNSVSRPPIRFCPIESTYSSTTATLTARQSSLKPIRLITTCSASLKRNLWSAVT